MDERFFEQAGALEQARRDEAVRAARTALQSPGQPYCDECGELIPSARRQAMPCATHCINCQQAFERGTS